eukprot:CAMPEP_0170601364 /NCGR_PEP_ID=MMETSP0224-20130122/17819_1 /TAXON_ID=285029 /ORGANISM="Togula jolla, Strain CCCM 725" /LENGTH=112 /DNA_ID=CAMNT_0010926133 /DNA_START=127 /DNA_END=465 /DNA_ORIENTATION=+
MVLLAMSFSKLAFVSARPMPKSVPKQDSKQDSRLDRSSSSWGGEVRLVQKRVDALRQAALSACLEASWDDTEAIEMCARLTRRLHHAEALQKQISMDSAAAIASPIPVYIKS